MAGDRIAPMRPEDCTYFESRAAFRAWLATNHDSATVLRVGFYKQGSGRASVTYVEAVEEALCFGWIDGVRHTVDELSFTARFTPRKPKSSWSAVNLKRVEALIARGLMHESGLIAYQQRDPERAQYSYEERPQQLPEPYLARFQAVEPAWRFFTAQPPWYQRTAAFWVVSAKQESTRERRLATLIADSGAGRRIKPLTRPGQT
jgi:uncharacterized protein YdeI (YjbR/CyaY-like superfamily)